MLALVMGLEGCNYALVERLTDRGDIGREKKYEYILILEATKATIKDDIVDFLSGISCPLKASISSKTF